MLRRLPRGICVGMGDRWSGRRQTDEDKEQIKDSFIHESPPMRLCAGFYNANRCWMTNK